MNVMATVDGIDLPGFRQIASTRGYEVDTFALFNRDSAQDNDIQADSAVEHQIRFEGTHTGPRADRRQADAALDALAPTKQNVTLETYWPGYDVDGFVLNYQSNFEARFGTGRHDYRLEFVVGERA